MPKFKPIIPMWLTEEEHAVYVAKNAAAEVVYNNLMETYDRKTSKYLLITGVNGYELIHEVRNKDKLRKVGSDDTISGQICTAYLYYVNVHPADTFKAQFVTKDELPEGSYTPLMIRSCRFSPEMDVAYGRIKTKEAT